MVSNGIRAMRSLLLSLSGVAVLAATLPIQAQTNVKASAALPLITQQLDNSVRTTLHGAVSPLAKRANDLGAADGSLQAPRVQLLLQRPADREAALQQYIADIHNKNSANYHKWLTPTQIAEQYGPADSDVQAVTAWLQSQGLTVNKVSKARSVIEFGGSAAQIQTAFNTSIHKYQLHGEIHYANATDPQIPSALAPVVRGIVRLNDFRPKSQARVLGAANYSPTTHKAKAQWNYPEDGGEIFLVDPGDFAVQYDTTPLTSAGTNGAGVTIGIIQDSNIDLTLVNAFRSLFSLPASTPQVIVDGTDPGINGDAIEAYLDVEWSGAVAPGATIDMYTAADTTLSAGLDLSAARAVDDDTAQVLSLSFGSCEYVNGSTENAYYNSLWEQAAAQGQTVMVSTGDSGSEGCDPDSIDGLAVNALAATPFNVAVGGTDFYYSDYASTSTTTGVPPSFFSYWSSGTTTAPSTTVLQYIPEQPWNDSQFGLNIAAYASGNLTDFYDGETAVGGGGGASACFNQTDNTDGSVTCQSGVSKPSFQSALTPADSVRDQPDVSLFAANGYNYSATPICGNPGDCNTDGQTAAAGNPETVTALGGTSVAAPSFAGVMALVVQKYGPQGQADYTLYPLAKQYPAAFHDVTVGSNDEPCSTSDSLVPYAACVTTDGISAAGDYSAGASYDEASGLGSVDANVLVSDWNKVSFTATSTTLALSSSTITHGASETLTATVAGATSGDVAFVPSAPTLNDKGANGYNSSSFNATTVLPNNIAQVGSNGTAALTTNTLPGGTYTITANYAGNGTAGTSQSTAQSITVNPEASNINLVGIQTQVVGNDEEAGYITNGTTYPYGTAIAADVQPVGASVSQASGALPGSGSLLTDGLATGTATFTDTGGAGSATVALNSQGIAEWSTGTFAVGAHSISATYSGDPSFKASSSSTPVTFTIAKGTPFLDVQPSVSSQQIGSNMTVQVVVFYLGVGAAPTGTVTVTYGSQSLTGTLVPFYAEGNYSVTTVNFPSITTGTAVSATYNGDSNWSTATGSAQVTSVSGSAFGATTTALTVTPSTSASNANTLTLTATVTGASATPTGTVTFLSNTSPLTDENTGLQSIPLVAGGASGTATATLTVLAADVYGGPNEFFAAYSGSTSYAPSSSGPATTSVDQSDFTLAAQNQVVTVAAGSSGTATINLGSLNGFDNTVNLTCASPSSNITCTINPTSLMVNGTATAAVTISVGSGTTAKNDTKSLWYLGGTTAFACMLFFGIPARRRSWRALLGLMLFAILVTGNGCGGGGSSSGGGGGGGGTNQAATPVITPGSGTYTTTQSVTITDSTSGSTIYYTTDGSTPTTSSSQYSGAISVASNETINAIATASNYTNSAVASSVITITPVVSQSGTNPTSHNVAISVVTPSGTSTVVVTGTVPAA